MKQSTLFEEIMELFCDINHKIINSNYLDKLFPHPEQKFLWFSLDFPQLGQKL